MIYSGMQRNRFFTSMNKLLYIDLRFNCAKWKFYCVKRKDVFLQDIKIALPTVYDVFVVVRVVDETNATDDAGVAPWQDMSDTGGRRKPSDTAGRSTAGDEDHRRNLPPPAGLAIQRRGRRTFSADDSGAVALDEDASKVTSRNQRRKRVGIISCLLCPKYDNISDIIKNSNVILFFLSLA